MHDADRLAALADAAGALAGELSLANVLETIVAQARHVTGAQYAALGVLDDQGAIGQFITEGVTDEQIAGIGHYPTGKGVLGLLIREQRVIRLDDIREHPESYGFPPNHPEMRSFLGAPVRSGGQAYGNLYLTEKPDGFDADDERALLVLAAQAGAAIENAQLSERLRSLAVQDERERISRELHDHIIQTLFSVGMGLESARGLVGVDPARVAERLDQAIGTIDDTIRDLRSFIFRLRPEHAASMGLARGLSEIAREHEVNSLVRPILDVPGDVDAKVDPALVPDLLAIVREALTNAAKHARASQISVHLEAAGELHLEIIDDGVGFDPTNLQSGRGLENMRERARALGASFEIDSRPEGGTTLALRIDGRAEGEEPT